MTEKHLPIKVIIQQERDITPNKGRMNGKVFVPITNTFIENITNKFLLLEKYYNDFFNTYKNVPAVGKVTLRDDAVAKSHKPSNLFKDLDIIGAEKFEELYIKVTPQGIKKTVSRINKPLSKQLESNLSTIENIQPIFSDSKISPLLKDLIEKGRKIEKLKIRIFNFGNDFDDVVIRKYIADQLNKLGYKPTYYDYGNKLNYFKIENVNIDDIESLAGINGIKKLDIFYQYGAPNFKSNIHLKKFEEPDNIIKEETIIGIIDSGISEKSILNNYVVARESYVPVEFQNREHGTFVASCLQYGSTLDNVHETNKKVFKFVDAIVIPNADKNKGPVDFISQDDFFGIVEELMEKYSKDVKIWNLSLGTNQIAEEESISDLGVFCDYIQDKYKIQFIIASGNYGENGESFREWHPQNGIGKLDRITTPADSCRAIVVGSVASKDSDLSIVKKGEPSPFSRRGPGANYMTKPELVDYGGNMLKDSTFTDVGVEGLDLEGNIVENVGTSLSVPKVSYKLAKIYNDLDDKDLLIAKAFLIHNARINSKDIDLDTDDINYYGFGKPSYDVENILQCSDNEITLMFKQKIIRGTHLEMLDFPFPKSLIVNGKYTGEIFMTLVYNPSLDPNYGSQYCRTNFEVSFGTYKIDEDGEVNFKGQVPLEKVWTERYEKSRITHGFKWNPIKSYYREIKNGIALADGWKIRIDAYDRDYEQLYDHEFVLLVTIRGDEDKQVYTDVVNELREKGFITQNLQTKYQVQQQIKN